MSNKQTKIIIESSKLDEALVRVNKSANGLADAIQVVLASATYQAVAHGNTNHLNGLILAVGKGVRKPAIVAWALAHAPVVMETDKEKAKENPFRFSRDKLEALAIAEDAKKPTAEEALAHAESILGMHWTEHKEPPLVPEKWDLKAAIAQAMKKAEDYAKKGTKVEGSDLLGKLAALLAPNGDLGNGEDIAGV